MEMQAVEYTTINQGDVKLLGGVLTPFYTPLPHANEYMFNYKRKEFNNL